VLGAGRPARRLCASDRACYPTAVRFQVLSHAGLRVEAAGRELLVDPWLVGSCYWRSWWNYPPVARALVEELRPSFVYLTHIHWDHFHGVSLRRFDRSTPVLVPKGHYDRMRRDLGTLGFTNVRELRHGETAQLARGFRITSYQFFPFMDSALVVEADGVVLLDANDAKFMGPPLAQILDRHPRIDFVLRSHSSANERSCYEIVDAVGTPLDDPSRYLTSFTAFAERSGARYAVPFASNHCHLHRETFAFNELVTTPLAVEKHFVAHGIRTPELAVMVSGDAWDSDRGFRIDPEGRRWFTERADRLAAYRTAEAARLEDSYRRDAAARVALAPVERHFARFAASFPKPLRLAYRGRPVSFVLGAGEHRTVFEVDLYRGRVRELAAPDPSHPTLEVHTSARIFKHCMASRMFSHLPISKRVRYRVTRETLPLAKLLIQLHALDEYELLPLADLRWGRALESALLRWREPLLYARIALDAALGRRFSEERHIRR
jgi:UDP-MurNAc hydroxylase